MTGKNAVQGMKESEDSDKHKRTCDFITVARKNTGGRVDKSLVLQTEEDIKYWHDVLRRIVAVVRSIAI